MIEHILHHGTDISCFEKIKMEGLTPRKDERRSNWYRPYQANSHPDMVYLTSDKKHADFYGLNAMMANGTTSYVKFTIDDIDHEALYPDDNYIISLDPNPPLFHTRELVLNAQNKIRDYKDQWLESLTKNMLVCHDGVIEPEKIVDYEIKGLEDNFYAFLYDPEYTRFNLKFQAFLIMVNHYHWNLDSLLKVRLVEEETLYNFYINDEVHPVEVHKR